MAIYDNGGFHGGTSTSPTRALFPKGLTTRSGSGFETGAIAPTLTADSGEVQVIASPAAPITVALPSANVLAGKIFRFVITGATETNYVAINATTEIGRIGGLGEIEVVALIDTPTAAAHWKVLNIYEEILISLTTGVATTGANIASVPFLLIRDTKICTVVILPSTTSQTLTANATAVLTFTAVPVRFRPANSRYALWFGPTGNSTNGTALITMQTSGVLQTGTDYAFTAFTSGHTLLLQNNRFSFTLT